VGAPQPGKVAFARIGGGPASPGMDGCALEPTETSPSRPAWRAIIVASVKAGSLLCQTLILGGALDSPNPDKLNSHAAKTYRLRGDSFGYDETVLKNASLST